MDLSINLTLVVQILNFFVAYILLKNFLFKQAFSVLQEKQQNESALNALVHEKAERVAEQHSRIKQMWQRARSLFAGSIPVQPKVELPSTSSIHIHEASQEEENILKKQLTTIIVQKVKHNE